MTRRPPLLFPLLLAGMVLAVGCSRPHATMRPLQAGLRAYERGHYEEALAAFRKAVAEEPKNLVAKTNLALTLQDLARYEEALSLY
ncbi:MAG: tetratricopeptide repeat protein, partial [bacterium]|nr:tetratricopeptide repeat protein [bacterium]